MIIISISLFVTFFMIIFQPFGLVNIPDKYKILVFAGYGLISFLVLVINLLIIRKTFIVENWKVIKELFWNLWIIFSIGFANFIFTTSLFEFNTPAIKSFIHLELYTLAIGVFPVLIITLLRYQYLNALNTLTAKKIGSSLPWLPELAVSKTSDPVVTIKSENGKDNLEINPHSLAYIESKGNYVYIIFSDKDFIQKKMIRTTLSSVLRYFSDFSLIVQCHRSYIVNRNMVLQVKGNAQGLKLKLKNVNRDIPVSRSFIKIFSE